MPFFEMILLMGARDRLGRVEERLLFRLALAT